ncbi:MAG: 2'-5' RNA ligase family protein [Rhizobiaceae bacterium]|nr:2'-5' RNA ligase family protein [Rhizobiaceae bacterium]
MPYAISLRCTNDTAAPILALWDQASAFEAVPSMASLNYPPHLTLAVYENINADRLRATLGTVFRGLPALPMEFSGIRHFDNEYLVLWASPVPSDALREAHESLHRQIDPILCHEHYRPGFWNPHCTLAMKIPAMSKEAALIWAAETPARFTVIFDVVDCVHAYPVEILHEIRLAG